MSASSRPAGDTVCIHLQATLLSDIHAGNGLGGAGIDAVLARDEDGKVVIRWSHLKGLLAEACRERFAYLGRKDDGDAVAERLFGKESKTGERGLLIGTSLKPVGDIPATSLVAASTSRDLDERSPREDTLRRVEYLAAGTRLSGEMRLPNGADVDVLKKLISRLDKIGADRSRGSGLVSIKLEERRIPRPLQPGHDGSQGKHWRMARVILRAVEPVCLAATSSPTNLIPGHSHAGPGTVRGLFTRWAIDQGLDEMASIWLNGTVIAGAAYPFGRNAVNPVARHAEVLPVPLSFQSRKPAGPAGRIPWWATEITGPTVVDALANQRSEKLKRPGANSYLVGENGKWRLNDARLVQAFRNNTGSALARKDKRRGKGKQDVFSIEEIEAGTTFVLPISALPESWCQLAAMLDQLKDQGHWLRLGRGGAPVTVVDWSEAVPVALPQGIREFVVLLETDLILRDESLGFFTHIDETAIHMLLAEAGVPLEDRTQVRLLSEVSEATPVIGWNAATKGHRLPAVGIRRGSVARLSCADPAVAARISQALTHGAAPGFGERAREGYGRLRLFSELPVPVTEQSNHADFPDSRDEAAVKKAREWTARKDVPKFARSRWNALRDVADDPRRISGWIDVAERACIKHKSPSPWLEKFRKEFGAMTGQEVQAIAMLLAKATQKDAE